VLSKGSLHTLHQQAQPSTTKQKTTTISDRQLLVDDASITIGNLLLVDFYKRSYNAVPNHQKRQKESGKENMVHEKWPVKDVRTHSFSLLSNSGKKTI